MRSFLQILRGYLYNSIKLILQSFISIGLKLLFDYVILIIYTSVSNKSLFVITERSKLSNYHHSRLMSIQKKNSFKTTYNFLTVSSQKHNSAESHLKLDYISGLQTFFVTQPVAAITMNKGFLWIWCIYIHSYSKT